MAHLHGADHGAEGEHGGRVPQGGLAVERPLGVHQQHRHLQASRATARHAVSRQDDARKLPMLIHAN